MKLNMYMGIKVIISALCAGSAEPYPKKMQIITTLLLKGDAYGK